MHCGVMGIPYKWDGMAGGALEVSHRCHWGAFGASFGALKVAGISLAWGAFGVSLGALEVSCKCGCWRVL